MGGSTSKDQGTNNVQSSELESSSGLHFLEVHFPTLGAGFGLVILGALLLFLCAKKRYIGKRHDGSPYGAKWNAGFHPALDHMGSVTFYDPRHPRAHPAFYPPDYMYTNRIKEIRDLEVEGEDPTSSKRSSRK